MGLQPLRDAFRVSHDFSAPSKAPTAFLSIPNPVISTEVERPAAPPAPKLRPNPSTPIYNQTQSMSVETELETIRTGAAIFPLTDRAFLRITGSDATRWLNGMVTNSIQSLQPGEGNYNFLLNAQGRIQGDCTIYREPGEGEATFLLETDKSQIDTIQTLLDKFIIMDDVELTLGFHIKSSQPEPSPLGIAIIGSQASHLLLHVIEGGEAVYIAPSPGSMTYGRLEGHKVVILTRADDFITTFEIWCDSRRIYKELYRKLEFDGPLQLSPNTLEAHRILSATPKYGVDIRNTETHKDLPQETAQTHALHFNKGCYLGQEIVERIRSRGQVHRTFTAFTLAPEGKSAELPTLPAPLEATIAGQTRPAGELTSAMRIGDTIHALGYLRREFANHPLTYPGGSAKPALSSHENPKPGA
jgi:folate-binding protein YgfZ